MDKKLIHIYEKGTKEELEKFLNNIQLCQIFNILQMKVNRGEDIVHILKIIFQGSAGTTNTLVQRRVEVFKFIITLLQSGELPSRLASELIGLLLVETDNFPTLSLAELAESLVNTLKTGKMFGNKWLDILPKVLTSLLSQNIITHNNIDMTGAEYRTHLIKCLCLSKWEPDCAVQLASVFREILLTNEELQYIIEKLLKILREVEKQEVPPLIYQLLLLSAEGYRKQILEGILYYFKKQDKIAMDHQEENAEIFGEPYDIEAIKHIEGTVILHVTFAAKQVQEIGKEFIKLLKAYQRQPGYILSPFCIALSLSVAKMQRFGEQIIEILKSMILCYFQEKEKKTHSNWMREMLSVDNDLPNLMIETIKSSKFGWDYVTQGLVQLGFALLDSFGPKITFGKVPDIGLSHTAHTPTENACSLGAKILQETFKIHETVRQEILQQILNRVITKTSRTVYHYIEVIAKTIQSAPQLLLDVLRKFREVLDYLPFLPFPSAIALLRAMTPLLKISAPLRDGLMVVLRKALFHRDIEARKVAISGFLIVLRNFKLLDGVSKSNQSFGSNQSYISLSQVPIEVHLNHKPGSFEALCLELLGTIRRVFIQQAEIRVLLYEGIHEVLCRNPDLSNAILELLVNQFEKYYEKNEDISPPLKLDSCIQVQFDEASVTEPIAHLLICIQLCVTTMLNRDLPEDDDDDEESGCLKILKLSLNSLVKRIITTDFEDFDLDKASDFSNTSALGKKNRLVVSLLLGIYESLMEYTFTVGNFSSECCKDFLSLYIAYNKIKELTKEKPNTNKKEGQAKSKKKINSSVPKSSSKSVFTLRFITQMLEALFCDNDPLHRDGIEILRGSQADIFHHFVSLANLRITQFQEKGKCDGICHNSEEAFSYFYIIGRTLLHQYQSSDSEPEVLSSCLNSLHQLFLLFCNYYPHRLKNFLSYIDSDESTDSIQCLIAKYIKLFQNYTIRNLGSESENNPLKDVIHHVNIISMLCKHLNPDNPTYRDTWTWVKQLCIDKDIGEYNIAKVLLSLYLFIARQDKTYVLSLRDIAHVIHCELGDVDEDVEIQPNKKFSLANEMTSAMLVPIIVQHMDYVLEEIDWVVVSMKAELNVKNMNYNRSNKEKNVCNQFGHLITACHELVQTAVNPSSYIDLIVKFLTRIYNSLSSLSKYYLSVYTQKVGEISPKFEKLVKLSGTHLTPQVYSMITYFQCSEENRKNRKKQKLDCMAEKAKVLRETKSIPSLIFAIEQYERHLIQLSKKSKVNLMEHIKLATSRDFRINTATVQAALENQSESDRDEDIESTANTNPVLQSRENIANSAQ